MNNMCCFFDQGHFSVVSRRVIMAAVFTTLIWFASSCSDPKPGISKAAHDGDLETVKALLKSNPNLVFDKDNYDTTPLHWAAQQGHKDIVALLLANGAQVNAKNKYGDTALHFAATGGSKEVVELLLANGADVNVVDGPPLNDTPLKSAASGGHQDIVELLRQHGAQ